MADLTMEDRALITNVVPRSLRIFFTGVRVADAMAALLAEAREEGRRSPVGAGEALGAWMSAALDDPKVCDAMKADIRTWFDAGQPNAGRAHDRDGKWITIEAEAAYYVDKGVNVVLCDRLPKPVTLVIRGAVILDHPRE